MAAHALLLNGHVLTMDPDRPHAKAVAVQDGSIIVVGSAEQALRAAPANATVIDCRGSTVVPGFIDAHLHLAAYAAALRAIDCRTARSIEEIVARVRARAAVTPPGEWIRAAGYDETRLAERRHPTRWDLDRATSSHPVRLLHRSGHALVCNSRALALAGLTIASEEPPGGVIDRRLCDGEPTGLLIEMNDQLRSIVPPLPRAELVEGTREASRHLLAAGVTAVQDLTHTNTPTAPAFLAQLANDSGFAPRLLPAAEGWQGWASPPAPGMPGPVKIMLRETGSGPLPAAEELARIVALCHARGRAVAVHAVTRESVAAAVAAFEYALTGAPLTPQYKAQAHERAAHNELPASDRPRREADATEAGQRRHGDEAALAGHAARPRHRIEHASICPPDLAERIAALGLMVVSNPGFLYESGDRYLASVPAADLPHLYATGALDEAGVPLAAGSDAPVIAPDPLRAIMAAVERRSASGVRLPGMPLPPDRALALHTTGAAYAAGADGRLGRIAPGMAADFAVLSGPPHDPHTRVTMTIIAGEIRFHDR